MADRVEIDPQSCLFISPERGHMAPTATAFAATANAAFAEAAVSLGGCGRVARRALCRRSLVPGGAPWLLRSFLPAVHS